MTTGIDPTNMTRSISRFTGGAFLCCRGPGIHTIGKMPDVEVCDMKKRRRRAVEGVRLAGLPEDVVFGLPKVTLMGEERASITNHEGILAYDADHVSVRTPLGTLEVTGTSLTLDYLGGNELLVQGKITQMGYVRRDGR